MNRIHRLTLAVILAMAGGALLMSPPAEARGHGWHGGYGHNGRPYGGGYAYRFHGYRPYPYRWPYGYYPGYYGYPYYPPVAYAPPFVIVR